MNDQLAGQVLEALNDKVDIDYGNMPANSTNYAPSSKNVTNCITEIPQDIKLEIDSNGYLILKAGSKLYVPNGADVYDVMTVSSDTRMNTTNTGTYILFCRADAVSAILSGASKTSSGATDSLAGETYHTWYDTTNNFIYRYSANATTPTYKLTLPLGIVTMTTGGICTSIDQVFNGFGYIGSCVFTLPGVKGLYPNGRNNNGTLKNGIVKCTTVQVSSNYDDTLQHCLFLQTNGRCHWYSRNDFYYNEETNTIHHSQSSVKLNAMDAGTFDVTSGVISNFNPKTAFRTVDYSDTEYMVHQAMPSDRYIDLTLGASGATYTAPADGYIILLKKGNYQQYITVDSGYDKVYADYAYSDQVVGLRISVRKGKTVAVWYTASKETVRFAFIYANGSK